MPAIQGFQLVLLTLAVSLGIFMNVLDTSIANVAIPTIAGNMGVSADEGTWVITSFAVSMAIVLPLTGWLAKRFGEVRLFVCSTALFTIASLLCGLSESLPMLVIFRVIQGAVAGPMIPLSQSLLLANYPDHKKGLATGLWAMVAVAAPVIGPILGGYITDNYSWPWIFYINLPVGAFSVYFTWHILKNRETNTVRQPIDFVGLILLAVGIGCLQVLLDKGHDLDWFHSTFICALAAISTICIAFLIAWELTDENPIIDLTLFKIRNFTVGTVAISIGYMTFFGSVVVLPLWLQTQMNYTATWAGLATAPIGILPILLSPLVGRLLNEVDARVVVTNGFFFFAFCSFWIANFNTDITFNNVAWVRFVQGVGAPCFFIPLITILLSGLPNDRIASAAGLSNFLRILGGSFGTSISVSLWNHREAVHQSKLTETLTAYEPQMLEVVNQLKMLGFSDKMSYAEITKMLVNQSYMLATNDIFWLSGFIFLSLLILVWFARPPFVAKQASMAE
ncbi:DHA2 family efflux MFS transporter permease subunit [Candidatus Berkiella aquae]|uniref:DHA2 family efflux MFS transporter permease subunit n=1 Tax=Candidatus Berkiella aquae TaxID=295108 RepID=A0A0Q9YB64_9GAMM|nr:DHA2 family efflux MFS transporter permease subunit [Candidatus Berkiella aquae]MCS5710613.1 DHA2 family efflux MFS transporter permease subunit [Candidatus Berkiella aquae]